MSKFSWRMLALAAVVAGGALASASGPASAVTMPTTSVPAASSGLVQEAAYRNRDRRHFGHHPYYQHRHYGHRRSGYTFYFGGWWYAQPWWQINPHVGGSAHVSWCLNRYRSYNPATNLFLGFDGMHHACRSPYRR